MTCRVSMPGLMTLSATLPLDRLLLLGHEDQAEAAFADLLQQLVGADHRAGLLSDGGIVDCAIAWRWRIKDFIGFGVAP